MKFLGKILLLVLMFANLLFSFTLHNVLITRIYDKSTLTIYDSCNVTVKIQNLENEDLRGFFYTEFIPSGLNLNNINLKIDNSFIRSYLFEQDTAGSVYDNLTAFRWVLENPPGFMEKNIIHPNSILEIHYSIRSAIADTFYLNNFEWTGYFTNMRGSFAHSNDSTGVIIIFLKEVVPVDLISFTAELIIDKVILKWITASENNNQGFEIERAVDSGKYPFRNIAFIPAKGNTSPYNYYEFADNDLKGGREFTYRLKQLNLDGSFEFVGEESIELYGNSFELFQNYPNPFNSSTIISFYIPSEDEINISVYNLLGELIAELVNDKFKPGWYSINFNTNSLPGKIASGAYFYRLSNSTISQTKNFILVK